jgi:hypothetical protein
MAAVERLGGGDLLSVFTQEGWLREERSRAILLIPHGLGSGWERVGHDLPAMAASFSREMGEHRDNRAELGDHNVGPARLVRMTRGTRTIGRTAREG